jgi:hypothetical protein
MMSGIMYGQPPDWGGDRLPARPVQPTVSPPYNVVTPAPPEDASTTLAALRARRDWLDRQLKMVEAWRHERATIQRMLDAAAPSAAHVQSEEQKR